MQFLLESTVAIGTVVAFFVYIIGVAIVGPEAMRFATPYLCAACVLTASVAACKAYKNPAKRGDHVGAAAMWTFYAIAFLTAYRFPVQYQ